MLRILLQHLLFTIVSTVAAQAATVTVSNTNDTGAGSLRQALTSAQSGDLIAFSSTTDGGAIDFYDGSAHTITLTSGELAIAGDLTITGPGARVLKVQRDSSAAVFRVLHVASGGTVFLSGVTISGGSTPVDGSFPSNSGGGLWNEGACTLSDCAVSQNSSAESGAGILNTGTLSIVRSTISGNAAEVSGGPSTMQTPSRFGTARSWVTGATSAEEGSSTGECRRRQTARSAGIPVAMVVGSAALRP